MEEEEDLTSLVAVLAASAAAATSVGTAIADIADDVSTKVDHRLLPRKKKKKYAHDEALHCIQRDYLGPFPLFDDKQFVTHFRVTRPRMERLIQDFGNSGDKFYCDPKDAVGASGASLEAKILLPLKSTNCTIL